MKAFKIVALVTLTVSTALFFQNCGGFKVQDLAADAPNFAFSKDLAMATSPQGGVQNHIYETSTGAGMNSYFISSYIMSLTGYISPSGRNNSPTTLAEVNKTMAIFDGSSIHHFREGLEMRMVFPAKGQIARLKEIIEVLKIYQQQDRTLILTFGQPLPAWMLSGRAHSWCPIPESNEEWFALKDNMAASVSQLAEAVWNHPEMDRAWLQQKFLIEGFNEFDSLGTVQADGSCHPGLVTGRRAADYSGAIQYYLDQKQLPITMLMPSGFGTNWFKDYYASGGRGQPNIHLYPSFASNLSPSSVDAVESYLSAVERILIEHQAVVPSEYRNKFILGEFGLSEVKGVCGANNRKGGAVFGAAHDEFLVRAFNHRIKDIAPVRLTWKMTDVKPMAHNNDIQCEATFGAFDASLAPKPQLIRYLSSVDGYSFVSSPPAVIATPTPVPTPTPQATATPRPTSTPKPTVAQLTSQIETMYRQILRRPSDVEGLNYYLNQARGGRALVEIENEIRISDEGQIVGYYEAYLLRAPDQPGMKYWLQDLRNGRTLRDVRDNIRRSTECKVSCL